ncbi:hypothetical protein GTP45_18915 [Pseudoduganella sp. FT55W]|uniref:Uncharacterized protein n=1 Tax=Duganella rivi TaxID=2666083 RepID=A0A7X4GSJ1_9BURK|nr:hypothetical protein [Duganella rivi]MYM68892.1 hypothetical protein [Duganella rivi]
MTIISGVRVLRAPCCGNHYAYPNYRSMNFCAFEYWTDGWSDGAAMPIGEGVRACTCGSLFLSRECELVEVKESSDLPSPAWASTDDFRLHIAKNVEPNLMRAMRLDLWRDLNHAYREEYRAHRDKEEADIQAEWHAANPDRRTWWDKVRRKPAPVYRRPDRPISFPRFEVSDEQRENMAALTALFVTRTCDDGDNILLAELFREQGRFDDAKHVLSLVKPDYDPIRQKVISTSLERLEPMPIRFRY